MTGVCSGGPSAPKAGVATSIVVDQAYIQSILPAGLSWLYPYLPFMHGLEIGDVPTFCGSDPPTWTIPTVGDIFAFITSSNIGNVVQVEEFLQDITKAYLWYNLCECTTVTTPAPPTAPSAPANLPVINPPTVVSPAPTTPCATQFNDPGITYCGANNPGLTSGLAIGGRNVTAARVSISEHNTTGAGFIGTLKMNWFSATTTLRVDQSTVPVTSSPTVHIFPAPPSGAITGQPSLQGNGVSGVDCGQVATLVEFFCNGAQPGGTNNPCCPPDPNLTALIHRIDQAVQLIQRQIAPFGYVDGPTHTALTDNGHFSITDPVIGVRVNCTTIPASYGQSAGDPVEHFDLGFVHLGNGDEWFGSRRLENGTTLWLPRWAGAADRIGYTLSPGIVATITELIREP